MYSMFVTEYLKYQKPVYIGAFVHVLALFFALAIGFSPVVRGAGNLWLLAAAVAASLFGVLQMRSNTRINNWIYLLHRPLSRQRICSALMLAAICLLAVALLLPYLLILVYLDVKGGNVIELRHYLLLPLAAALVLSAYLVGCFATLHPQRLGFLTFTAMWVFLANIADTRVVLFGLLLLLLFGYLVFSSFREDLSTPVSGGTKILLSELPIQFGLFWIMVMLLMLVFETKWSISNDNPMRNPAPGTDYTLFQQSPESSMLAALEGSTHPDTVFMRQQIAIGEIVPVLRAGLRRAPQRHQRPLLDRDGDDVLSDSMRGVTWRFSHSVMLFEGFDNNTLERIGWLGPDGFSAADPMPDVRFDTVPWVTANTYVLNAHHLYQVDWDTLKWRLRFSLDEEVESFNDSLNITENVSSLLSTNALYLFRSMEVQDIDSELITRTRLPMEHDNAPLQGAHVLVMELLSGYLVSIVANSSDPGLAVDFELFGKAKQFLYRTSENFDNELINRKMLPSTFSQAYIYKEFVLSPGMRLTVDMLAGWFRKKSPELTYPFLFHRFPPTVLALAVFLNSIALVLGWRLLRRMAWTAGSKRTWLALIALNGLLGLASLYFGLVWRRYTGSESPSISSTLNPVAVQSL